MDGLTRLGLVLIFVFVFFLLTLAAELAYVLWYRSRFRREPPGGDDPEVAAAASAAGGAPFGSSSSKELLLYFICLRNQSQNGRAMAAVTPVYGFAPSAPGFPWPPGSAISDAKPLQPPPPPPPPPPPRLPPPLPSELAKWRDVYSPEVLSTISGGEEGETGDEQVVVSSEDVDEEVENEVLMAEPVLEVTPFSTPCCSTPFYTPPPSPPRGAEAEWELKPSPEDEGSGSDEDEFFFPSEDKLAAE